jgi:hypothetical protein
LATLHETHAYKIPYTAQLCKLNNQTLFISFSLFWASSPALLQLLAHLRVLCRTGKTRSNGNSDLKDERFDVCQASCGSKEARSSWIHTHEHDSMRCFRWALLQGKSVHGALDFSQYLELQPIVG